MIIYSCDHLEISNNAERIIREQCDFLLAANNSSAAFAVVFNVDQYYLAEPTIVKLIAIIHLAKININTEEDVFISTAIFSYDEKIINAITILDFDLFGCIDINELKIFANKHQTPWLELSAPLMLEPVKIAKPWGQEIWYTGIEARGQSSVVAQGFLTPLPWVLALMPEYFAEGNQKKILLLKTLDPLPDAIYGDLYFELHEKKQEVYVVTHINSQAWENNTGAIRLGFDQNKRAEFANDDAFKSSYLMAVNEYEKIRRTIDDLIDIERKKHGLALHMAVETAQLWLWLESIPSGLREQEDNARTYMNSFTALRSLNVGDVVRIPCCVPHALQHGVRTVEFQTPVYERKILSFAQKVLTQQHWDTQAALEKAILNFPEQNKLPVLFAQEGVVVEEVVKFDGFQVKRINLLSNTAYHLPNQHSYGLLMPIGGACVVEFENKKMRVDVETAIFLPYGLFSNVDKVLWLHSEENEVQILVSVATE